VEWLADQGVTGVGDAAVAYGTGAASTAAMIKEPVQQFVMGKDPFGIEAIWSDMYDHTFWAKGGGTTIFAGISAIEQALWDLKGKCLGVPVYEMLGVLSVGLRKEGEPTYFWEESPRIRRTEVRPTRSRRAISALATPARCSLRISAA